MKPSFHFELDLSVTLDLEEIWPDGDAPENPTVEDVWAVFCPSRKGYDLQRACEDWDLLRVEGADVRIVKLEGRPLRLRPKDEPAPVG